MLDRVAVKDISDVQGNRETPSKIIGKVARHQRADIGDQQSQQWTSQSYHKVTWGLSNSASPRCVGLPRMDGSWWRSRYIVHWEWSTQYSALRIPMNSNEKSGQMIDNWCYSPPEAVGCLDNLLEISNRNNPEIEGAEPKAKQYLVVIDR